MSDLRRILVTGGSGFIGSAVCRRLAGQGHHVVNLDKLTYAATRGATAMLAELPNYRFAQIDICDGAGVAHIFTRCGLAIGQGHFITPKLKKVAAVNLRAGDAGFTQMRVGAQVQRAGIG